MLFVTATPLTQSSLYHTAIIIAMHYISRLTIVSREAKKKQAVRGGRVSYVLVIPQNEYGILVITRDRGAAEVKC